MSEKKPEIVVFAGPNGSGKSTFTELLRPPMDYINYLRNVKSRFSLMNALTGIGKIFKY